MDKDITGLPGYRISHLGITRSFQITSLFPDLSVLENVRIALQSREKVNMNFFASLKGLKRLEDRAWEILEMIGLADFGEEKAAALDYGAKRCLEIGIALGTDPKMFLFDEPTSGMDSEESARIIQLDPGYRHRQNHSLGGAQYRGGASDLPLHHGPSTGSDNRPRNTR